MVLLDRLKNADDDSGNAYLRARGANAPESIKDKFRTSGTVYKVPDGLEAAKVNAVFCTSAGPRVLVVRCEVSSDRKFAYMSHESIIKLFYQAARDGVAL